MGLKVLGGQLKAMNLSVPKSETRPTSVLLRRKLFDVYQNLGPYIFVDLCAGSGAVGIEAFSRGAEKVYLIESSRPSFKILSENVSLVSKRCQTKLALQLIQSDCRPWLKKNLPDLKKQTDFAPIIFLDPPYENEKLYLEVIEILSQAFYRGHLWIESDVNKGLSLEKLEKAVQRGPCGKLLKHGSHFVALWPFG